MVRLHKCKELFESFLSQYAQEDRKLATFVQYVYKDHSRDFPEFTQKVISELLLIADKDQFILERLDSVQAGISLLRINQSLVEPSKITHIKEVLE